MTYTPSEEEKAAQIRATANREIAKERDAKAEAARQEGLNITVREKALALAIGYYKGTVNDTPDNVLKFAASARDFMLEQPQAKAKRAA